MGATETVNEREAIASVLQLYIDALQDPPRPVLPGSIRPGLGIHTRRAGSGRQLPSFRSRASSSSRRSTS